MANAYQITVETAMIGKNKKKRLERTASIGEILEGLLKRKRGKAAPAMAQIQLWEKWDTAVGPTIAKQAWPLNFKNGILFVGACNPAWVFELQYQRHQLMERLNNAVGRKIVANIIIKRAKRD